MCRLVVASQQISRRLFCTHRVDVGTLDFGATAGLLDLGWRGFLFLARSPTYGKTTLSQPNSLREQDDIEGIHLRLREGARTIPRIPASGADVFRSSVRHCIIELRISKDRWLLGPTQQTANDSRGKASRARLSDGRRRPPAARRDGRDKAETILWRRFRSGPVIVAVGVERDLGSVFFDLSYRR